MATELDSLKLKIDELEHAISDMKQQQSSRKQKKEYEPAECDICHKMFSNKYVLKTHIHNQHDPNRQFPVCPHCNKKLSNKYYLAAHIANKHSAK